MDFLRGPTVEMLAPWANDAFVVRLEKYHALVSELDQFANVLYDCSQAIDRAGLMAQYRLARRTAEIAFEMSIPAMDRECDCSFDPYNSVGCDRCEFGTPESLEWEREAREYERERDYENSLRFQL